MALLGSVSDLPAPLGRRVFSRVVDVIAVLVFAVPVLALTLQDETDGSGVRFPWPVIVAWVVLPAVVEALVLVKRHGQTPGKRLSGLRVVRGLPHGASAAPTLGLGTTLVRSSVSWSVPAAAFLLVDQAWILAAILAALYVPALVPGLRRSLSDLVSNTRVRFIGDVTDEAGPEIPVT